MPKIALQLYSVREACAKDFPATLKSVADMGYQGVEFAGYHGMSAIQLKKLLDDLGMEAAGTHTRLETLLGDEFKKTVEFNQTLGNKNLIVPSLPKERTESKAAWQETAKLFNEIAEKLKPFHMFTGYHNHIVEFQPLDGELPWDTFFGATDNPVIMQLDFGNAMHGGATNSLLIGFLKKYPGRARTVHIKDFSSLNKAAIIGEGDVNWEQVLPLCESTGNTEWYIIEQESVAYPPLDCVRQSILNLKKLMA